MHDAALAELTADYHAALGPAYTSRVSAEAAAGAAWEISLATAERDRAVAVSTASGARTIAQVTADENRILAENTAEAAALLAIPGPQLHTAAHALWHDTPGNANSPPPPAAPAPVPTAAKPESGLAPNYERPATTPAAPSVSPSIDQLAVEGLSLGQTARHGATLAAPQGHPTRHAQISGPYLVPPALRAHGMDSRHPAFFADGASGATRVRPSLVVTPEMDKSVAEDSAVRRGGPTPADANYQSVESLRGDLKQYIIDRFANGFTKNEQEQYFNGVRDGFRDGYMDYVNLAKAAFTEAYTMAKVSVANKVLELATLTPGWFSEAILGEEAIRWAQETQARRWDQWRERLGIAVETLGGLGQAIQDIQTKIRVGAEILDALGETGLLQQLLGSQLATVNPSPAATVRDSLVKSLDALSDEALLVVKLARDAGPYAMGYVTGMLLWESVEYGAGIAAGWATAGLTVAWQSVDKALLVEKLAAKIKQIAESTGDVGQLLSKTANRLDVYSKLLAEIQEFRKLVDGLPDIADLQRGRNGGAVLNGEWFKKLEEMLALARPAHLNARLCFRTAYTAISLK